MGTARPGVMKRAVALLIILGIGWSCSGAGGQEKVGSVGPFHPTSPEVTYKCFFNHDTAIFCSFLKGLSPADTGPAYLASYVEKLEGTDVDVLFQCAMAMRAHAYPSLIDPRWQRYEEGQKSKWGGFDSLMKYIHDGGDPLGETLAACRRVGLDYVISYRMNDAHEIVDKDWPTHPDFWRNHPEYWLGDSNISITFKPDEDNVRMHNYMLPEVRDWYYSILEELCTMYDVDGLELDFQRAPRFFYNKEVDAGREVMTGFVKRVRTMLDRIGKGRGKHLKLCVRIPETLAKCDKAGLDVIAWDKLRLVDMINVSPYYLHSLDVDIEDFQARTQHAKIYAEMESRTQAIRAPQYYQGLRYTTIPAYWATALNYLSRGADGIGFFNYDYVPHGSQSFHDKRVEVAQGLKGITDVQYLRVMPKHYIMTSFRDPRLMIERYKTVENESVVEVIIPDDTSKVDFTRAVLRVETTQDCQALNLAASLNGKELSPCDFNGTELFPRMVSNSHGYPTAEQLKFYEVPLGQIVPGKNTFEVRNLDVDKASCAILSLELAMYRWVCGN